MKRELFTFVACLVVMPTVLEAQVTDMLPSDGPFALEWHKPFFDGGDEFSFVTSTLLARVLAPVGERVFFSGDLGLSLARADGESSGALSNPEIGLVFVDENEVPRGRVSVMLPFSTDFGEDDFGVFTGLLTFPERFDRFLPDAWSVNGMLTSTRTTETGLIGYKVGGSVIGSDDLDTEFFGRYGAFVTATSGSVRLGAEVSGEILISESDGSLGERTIHQLTLSVGPTARGGFPQVFLRLPLDGEVNDFLDVVVGARVTF